MTIAALDQLFTELESTAALPDDPELFPLEEELDDEQWEAELAQLVAAYDPRLGEAFVPIGAAVTGAGKEQPDEERPAGC